MGIDSLDSFTTVFLTNICQCPMFFCATVCSTEQFWCICIEADWWLFVWRTWNIRNLDEIIFLSRWQSRPRYRRQLSVAVVSIDPLSPIFLDRLNPFRLHAPVLTAIFQVNVKTRGTNGLAIYFLPSAPDSWEKHVDLWCQHPVGYRNLPKLLPPFYHPFSRCMYCMRV